MRLYELAYACRLYAEFTDYDEAIEALRRSTAPAIDLEQSSHRKALLVWLNAWGCRQFAIEYHPMASRALQKWARECNPYLPPMPSSLSELTPEGLDLAGLAYERLMNAQASVRRGRSGEYAVTFGPTGAAKVLYALRPEVFLPWDDPIRDTLDLDGSPSSYRTFLASVQATIRALIDDANQQGFIAWDIPATIGRPGSSLPKLIDEFYWVTITNGVRLPAASELGRWYSWARDNKDSQ